MAAGSTVFCAKHTLRFLRGRSPARYVEVKFA